MNGSSYGKSFCITTWGESHGSGIGAVIDGCPAGLVLSESDIQAYLDRRKPGQNKYTTLRSESDQVEILSGIFEGRTTGTPISILVRNQDQRSGDYGRLADLYRPGHADYTFSQKYGTRDYRGGGRSSGRETIGRVAGGAIASLLLKELGISVLTFAKSIGPVTVPASEYCFHEINENALYMPCNASAKRAAEYLDFQIEKQDSCGGTIECIVTGMPPGIGEPVFEKLDANLAKAVMSVGAVKAVEIGDGIRVSEAAGSENNDAFTVNDHKIQTVTNHAGGVLGGISNGSDIVLRASVKPTPSISREQKTVDLQHEEATISIHGRHDPIIVPRAVVVIESMVALTLIDMLFQNMSSRLDKLKEYYEEK